MYYVPGTVVSSGVSAVDTTKTLSTESLHADEGDREMMHKLSYILASGP